MAVKTVQLTVQHLENRAGNGDFGSPVVEKMLAKGVNKGVKKLARHPLMPAISTAIVGIFVLCGLYPPSVAAGQHDLGDHRIVDGVGNLDHLLSSYQSQGLRINRLSTDWRGKNAPLTVGNDWSNFHDFLHTPTSERITWSNRNGFSILLENPVGGPDPVNVNIESLQGLSDGSPNLILSWQGEFADRAGRYRVSALGRKLNLKGVHDGVVVDDDELGWGVQLAGGWRFGDLFAALRVTLGNGIDSLILKRFGSDIEVSPSGRVETLESISILPSLNYSITKRSDLRLSLGRYESRGGEETTGIETLDTINLGYTWSPWPATQFGVEVVGKDFEGAISDEDSTEIKIGAEKRF